MAIDISKTELNRLEIITIGGEATIYNYSKDKLLKEFNKNANLSIKENKIDMLMNICKIENLISPSDKVLMNGKFIGYLMDKVINPETFSMLSKKKYLKIMNFSNKDIVDILVDTAITFEKIHKKDFIIGDISDQNILISEKKHYFIDSDSFGFKNKFLPDVYTETFTDPNAYNKDTVIHSFDTDKYAFAILVFKTLTRIHPFNGTLKEDKLMDTTTRMANKISVLGKHEIIIPAMIPSWKWLSPNILNIFLDIFEKDKRNYITDALLDLQSNLKFCKNHGEFYYGKYNKCPICNPDVKVIIKPTVTKANITNNDIILSVILHNESIKYILDFDKYLSNTGNIISIKYNSIYKFKNNCRVEFLNNGDTILEIYDNKVNIFFKGSTDATSSISRAYKSNYSIVNNMLYYIDESYNLCKIKITKSGNIKEVLLHVYTNTIFESFDNENYCAILLYPKKGIIATKSAHIPFYYTDKIIEYAIKHDTITGNFLFIYQTNKGEFRTIILNSSKILFDSTMFRYTATPLSNICFNNNNIFAPSNGKIVGINWSANRVKDFEIDIVSEDSKLDFINNGFNIISGNKIYRYGK